MLVTLLGGASTRIANATAKVKSIEITTLPERCTYNVGDGYSTKGIVVVAKMSDGTKETIDNSKITSFSGVELTEGRAFQQEGWKSVELRYAGAKTTYGIAVLDPLKEYFITFNSDGGSAVDAKKIDTSTEEFKLPTSTKKGAIFLGWYHSNGTKYTKYQSGMGTNELLNPPDTSCHNYYVLPIAYWEAIMENQDIIVIGSYYLQNMIKADNLVEFCTKNT